MNFKHLSEGTNSLPWVPEVFFSVSFEGKKTSGNGGQLTDGAVTVYDCVRKSLSVALWVVVCMEVLYLTKGIKNITGQRLPLFHKMLNCTLSFHSFH